MSLNTYKNERSQPSPIIGLRSAGVVATMIAGLAIYNQEKILDGISPKPPVVQVYNNNSCLNYDSKIYVLIKETAFKGDGIDTLVLRHNPRPTPILREAFKAANSGSKFFYGSGLYEGKQYLTPAPDKENKCK